MSSWWQFPWHPPPELEVLPRADDQLFQRSSLPSRGPLDGPNKGPLVAIHPYTPSRMGKYIYNAWVCDVFFQNGDFKGKGLRMSRWVSDCGGQEEVLSASTSGSFQVAISTAMFWRWGHGMMDESSWIVELLPHRFILQVKLWVKWWTIGSPHI